MISALLCVTLDGQILGRWVFVVGVTRAVVSVTKSIRVNHNPIIDFTHSGYELLRNACDFGKILFYIRQL